MEYNRDSNKKPKKEILTKMFSIIKKKPGIRPTELNRLLNLEHSANLRDTFIKQGLVRKERKGKSVHYYTLGGDGKN